MKVLLPALAGLTVFGAVITALFGVIIYQASNPVCTPELCPNNDFTARF